MENQMEFALDPPAKPQKRTPRLPLHEFVKTQIDFSRDQIGFFQKMHDRLGDNYQVRLGPYLNFVTHDPAVIEQVLISQADVFQKDIVTHDLEVMLGKGLLTSEGEFWKRQRRLAAPSLKRKQIASYADTMVQRTVDMLDRWDGSEIEIHDEMMELTLQIVVNTLFGMESGNVAKDVGESLETAMHTFHLQNHTMWRFVPRWVPTHLQLGFDKALGKLDSIIYDLIRERRASNIEGDDLLYRLIIATDEEGNQMTDKQLRDESLTMFLAGHETTALAMSYSWHVLAEEPEILATLQTEISEVIGDRLPSMDDTRNLPHLKAFMNEVMRMYPPAWMIGRQPTEPVELAGYQVNPGEQVLMPISIIHRDARWFEDPDTFRLERWMDGSEKKVPKFAYFPFGGGTRICIGNHFAIMEIMLCLATMLQRVELENRYPEPLRMQPAVTLRPVTEMRMGVQFR